MDGMQEKGALKAGSHLLGICRVRERANHSRSARLSGGGPREVGEAWAGLLEFSRKSRVAFFANNSQGLWKGGACASALHSLHTGLSEPPGLSKPLLASLEQSGPSHR